MVFVRSFCRSVFKQHHFKGSLALFGGSPVKLDYISLDAKRSGQHVSDRTKPLSGSDLRMVCADVLCAEARARPEGGHMSTRPSHCLGNLHGKSEVHGFLHIISSLSLDIFQLGRSEGYHVSTLEGRL